MPIDALELQLAAAVQRYNALQRRADAHREPEALLNKTFAELGTALEEVRVVQEQLIEQRTRMELLQAELRQQYERYWQLFDEMPGAYVVTKGTTAITEVNKAAANLVNVSQRFLVGKALSVFVCEERAQFLVVADALARQGGERQLTIRLRPRERAPLTVHARVVGEGGSLRWILNPVGTSEPEPGTVSEL